MDNFEFDLQLFENAQAPVVVDLTSVNKVLTTETTQKAYVVTDGVGSWQDYEENNIPDDAVATLVNGTLSVVVGTAETPNTVQLKGVKEAELAGVRVVALSALTNGVAKLTSIALDGVGAISAATLDFTSKGIVADAAFVTIDDDGVISELSVAENKVSTFSVYDSMSDTQPTNYKATATGLVVTGDQLGIYNKVDGAVPNDFAIANVKVTLVKAGPDNVKYTVDESTEKAVTATVPGPLTLVAQETAGTNYYGIKDDGSIITTPVSSATGEGAVAWFKVVTDVNYGEPTATISVVDAKGNPVQILGDVSIKADALTKVGTFGITKLNIADTAAGKVNVTGVATTADVVIGTTTYKKDNATAGEHQVSYTKTYVLGDTKTIALKQEGNGPFYYEITSEDAGDHGKQTCSIGSGSATKPTEHSYFSVTKTPANGKTTYDVKFVAVEEKVPETITGWSGIVVDATGLPVGDAITITGDSATDAKDSYAVINAPYGVVVDKETYKKISSVTRKGDETLTVSQGDSGKVTLLIEAGTKFYAVTDPDDNHDGNRVITIVDVATEKPASGSYFQVTNAGGKCTVAYVNNGNISLSGLPENIKLVVPTGFTKATAIDITDDSNNPVNYSITDLPAGTVVTGATADKDSITYTTAIYNNVNLDLATLTDGMADGTTVYYAIKKDTTSDTAKKNAAVGYVPTYVLDGTKLTEANTAQNIFAITKKADNTYIVNYIKATTGEPVDAVDLAGTTVGGATNINAAGIPAGAKIQLDKTDVNKYTATNVVSGGFAADAGFQLGTVTVNESETTFVQATEDPKVLPEANITYSTSDKFTQTGSISLNTDNLAKIYKVTATTVKGVTTYTIDAAAADDTAAQNNPYKGSYFKVEPSADSKTLTIKYVEGTAEDAVSLSTFIAKASDKVKVDATSMDTTKYTTIVLTPDDATKKGISYAVTEVPAGVAVENATDKADSISYVEKSVLTPTGNTITLGTEAGTVYYTVTDEDGKAVKGIYECSIGKTALTEKPADTVNYFMVKTESGKVTVTYHQAKGDGALPHDLANSTVNLNAKAAAETLTITVGSDVDDSDSIKYNASELTKGQTLVAGDSSSAVISSDYQTSYAVAYTANADEGITADGLKLLADAAAGTIKYYAVTRSAIATNGEYTYTVATTASKPTTGAYFAVTYASDYITTVSYVNVSGDATLDLSKIGKQITIDASASTASQIDITDTESSKVNYALTGVQAGVEVVGASTGDTVARIGGEINVSKELTLGDEAVAYYVVKENVDKKTGAVTYSLDKLDKGKEPTTADNYITITKTVDGYEINYTQSATATAYTFGEDTELTVDAKGKGDVKTTGVGEDAKVVIKNATPAKNFTGATDVTYVTGFTWAAGDYYLPIEAANSSVSLDEPAGTTTVGGKYVQITVTETEGVFKVTKGANVIETNGTSGMAEATTTGYGGSVTITAPDTAIKLDGTGLAGTTITNVAKDSTLTNIAPNTEITTAALSKDDKISINESTCTAGGGKITLKVANDNSVKVYEGVVALGKKDDTVTGSAAGAAAVTLTESTDGVLVTYEDGAVTAIKGLATAAEKVTYNGATYIVSGSYIKKFNSDNTSEWAAAPGENGDVLNLKYYPGSATAPEAVKAGGFAWDTGKYLVKADTAIEAKGETASDIDKNSNEYVLAEVDDSKQLTLTIMKNNSVGLPTKADTYTTSKVSIVGGPTAFTYKKAATDNFAVTLTNVANGSKITVADGDSITTAALAKDESVTVNGVAYKAAVAETLVFDGNALKDGTVTTAATATAKAYALADGSTLECSESVQITMADDGKLTSITGLSGDAETVTITKGNTQTVYTNASADGKTITVTETNTTTQEIKTSTITLAEKDANVLAGTAGGSATTSYTNTFAWDGTTATFGYFKLAFDSASGITKAELNTTANSGNMTDGDTFVKATLTPTTTTSGNTTTAISTKLELTVGNIENGKFKEAANTSQLNGTVIDVAVAAGAPKVEFANTYGCTVNLTGVPAGSELTLKKEDTVTTATLTAGSTDTITINGQDYQVSEDASSGVKFYVKNTDDVRVVGAASLYLTDDIGALTGRKTDGSDGTTVEIVKAADAVADGKVAVTFDADGKATAIKGLDAGETVGTFDGTVTKTYTANAKESDIVYVTVKGAADATKNGTFVKDIGGAGDDIIGNTDGEKVVSNDYTFSWAEATTSEKPAYFLVSDDGSVTVDTNKVTIDHTNYKQTVIKASIDSDKKLTLVQTTVGKTGAVEPTTADVDSTVKALTLAIGGQTVSYAKTAGIPLTVTGAGANSTFTGVEKGDQITTTALASGASVTVNMHKYTAGVANDTLVIDGEGQAVSGTFTLKTAANNDSANELKAYHKVADVSSLDNDDPVTTKAELTYTKGSGTGTEGANVVVEDGLVKSITGMGDGEQVVVKQTTTTKANGKGSEATTTYSAKKDGSVYIVTKTVKDAEGKETVYQQTFSNDTQNVVKDTGWTTTQQTTTTAFDFGASDKGSVGYFKATASNNVYTAGPIAKQTNIPDISGNVSSEADRYYVRVTASQSVSGAITIKSIELVHLETSGAWTVSSKKLGDMTLTLPTGGATVALPTDARSYKLTITAGSKDVITNVQAQDVVTATLTAADDTLKVNDTVYVAGAATAVEIKGDGSVTKGVFTVKDAALKEAGKFNTDGTLEVAGDTISYTTTSTDNKDGAIVTVVDGKVTTIAGLKTGESVTITSADGQTVTTYKATDNTTIEKTVVQGGVTETMTATITADADVLAPTYKTTSKFDWGATEAGKVGYFAVDNNNAATVKKQASTGETITPEANKVFARVQVSGDATSGYTISSVKLLSGTKLDDVTAKDDTTKTEITISAPGSLTLANAVEGRKYTLNITDAQSGQTFAGLSAADTVTTGDLVGGSTVTVNNVTYKNADKSTMVINGDGTAKTGKFALASGSTIEVNDTTSEDRGNWVVKANKNSVVTVVVTNNVIKSVTGMDIGETVVATKTDANGVATTYTFTASKPKTGSGILITRTTEANGTKKVETYLAADNGDNIVNDDYVESAGNTITSNLNWTKVPGSTGYFQAKAVKDTEGNVIGFADVVEIAAENKDTKIAYNKNSDNLYLQVSTVYDSETNTAKITGLKPWLVTETGTLSDDMIGDAASFEGTVTLTAPSGVALSYNASTLGVPNKVVANITGATADSNIVIRNGDTLTTATLTAGSKVKVNGSDFTTGANSALKFTANTSSAAILADGTVKVPAGTLVAAGATIADTDDVTVTVAGSTAIVKVTNGVVTAISGQANGGTVQTVTAGGATIIYTYDGKKYDVTTATGTTGEVALAALSEGSTLEPFGTGLVSGASNNNITFYNGKLKNGVVKLTAGGSIMATGSSVTKNNAEDTSDDITVTYGQATTATKGAAVVTALNGKITSIKGLAAGETIAISEGTGATAKYTFYKMEEAGTVKMGTGTTAAAAKDAAEATDAQTAYIAAGGDLMSANFIGGGSQDTLIGQFNWDTKVNGRNVGYFAIKESSKGKTATIADQATEVAATAKGTDKKPVTNNYLVASIDEKDALSIGALSVKNNGSATTTAVIDMSTFTAADMVTITAPTTAITYDKGTAPFGVTINKLGAKSVISGLDAGDKVVTATLETGETVELGGVTYTAGAKGTMTFVGEGDGTANPSTAKTALLNGTIKLDTAPAEVLLSGAAEAKDTGAADDVHVSTTGTDVIVKVANGVITSITGLTNQKSVEAWTGASKESATAVRYTVLNKAGTMIKKEEVTYTNNTDKVTSTQYLNLAKAGSDITKGKYADAEPTAVSDLSFTSDKATFGYVQLTGTGATVSGGLAATVSVGAIDSGNNTDLITDTNGKFNAVPEAYYLQIKATTAAKTGVTTINAVDLMQAGATGKLTAVKSNAKVAYSGTLAIDGTVTATPPAAYATFNYALPAASKRDWKVNVTNAALGSTFTNLGANDLVATANAEGYELKGKTVTVYKNDGGKQELTQVTAKGDGVKLTVANGEVTSVTDFGSNGETLTVVSKDPSGGLATYEYKATVKNGKVTITRTITDQEGNKNVATSVEMTEAEAAKLVLTAGGNATYGDNAATVTWTTAESNRTVMADFDWTMQKASVGYFAVTKNAATVKSGKTTITAKNTTPYIAVEISADGVVDSISQMVFDTKNATSKNMKATDSAFSGKITITAPTAVALNFDRSNVDGTTINNDETTTFEIKGAIAKSVIANLGNGDTVATARLAAGDTVSIGGYAYTAGAAGTLGFTHKADADFVTAGTVKLTKGAVSNQIGTDIIYIYDGANSVPIQVTAGSITVQASTTNKGVTTFTIGDLGENETFTVGEVTYQKSGSTLFKSVDGEVTEVCALTGNTIKSTALTGKSWTTVKATFSDGEDGTEQKSAFGVVTTDLALADKRIAADKKAGTDVTASIYKPNYVLDKYVKSDTKTSDKTALKAEVVGAKADWQVSIGVISALNNGTDYTYQYKADSAIGQAIKVAKNWAAVGSDYADTITGASAGDDFIRAGQGKDTIALAGATDTVAFDLSKDGHNVVTGYTSKDKLIIDDGTATAVTDEDDINYNNDFSVYLDTEGNNVYLYTDDNNDGKYVAADDANSIMLKGMGTGKAVTINGKDFYFGNGTLAKGKTATTAGTTFTYAEGAYYYGNDSGKNALKVATDKTKASSKTLGDDVTIDLTAVDADGRNLYNHISTIDASASGNRVVLTAGATDTTLKGGSYQSTLKGGAGNDTLQGGSGQDVFWFDDLGGQDTVKSYTSGKDAVYLSGKDDLKAAGYEVAGDEKGNVVITNGDPTSKLTIAGAANPAKAIKVSTAGKVDGASVSYFVGKSGAKASNAFTYVDGAYYVGNKDTNDATGKVLDTLKVTGSRKTRATINLSTNQYQSIEAVDASTVKADKSITATAAANAGVDVTASAAGTKFTGTAYNDTFTCGNGKDYIVYKGNQGADTIDSFGVGDVIQLNGLNGDKTAIAAEIDKINAGTSSSKTLSFAKGGSVTFTNISAGTKLTYDSSKGTITGTASN